MLLSFWPAGECVCGPRAPVVFTSAVRHFRETSLIVDCTLIIDFWRKVCVSCLCWRKLNKR